MYILIIAIHIIACLILIAAILLQSGRGGGLAELFGGGASQTIFGARASTFLSRTTTVAAIAFLLTCISLTILSSRKGKSLLEGVRQLPEKSMESIAQVGPEETEEEQRQESEAQPEVTQDEQ